MKKRISLLLAAFSLIMLYCIASYASTITRSIPSARITLTTGGIDFTSALEDTPDEYVKVPDNQYYELDSCEWLDDISTLKPGSTPRIKVRLEALPKETTHNNYDVIYLFRGSYSASNVSITKGTLESATIQDSGYFLEITIKMNALTGSFDTPQNADWSEAAKGTAVWTVNDIDSGVHDIICYRGSAQVKKLTNYKGTSYNFFPYMTKEGSYKYKIRTVADPTTGVGKSSEWLESGELYISANEVSDGTGQTTADENGAGQSNPIIGNQQYPNGTGNAATVGWMQQGGYYYFLYPDGNYAKSGWMKLDNKWYMFDDNGHMLTGWQKNKYGKWFYLNPSTGVMKTGWFKDNNNWYFLDTTEGDSLGCMRVGWLKWNDKWYYFNSSGIMVTGWYNVNGSYRYFYPEGSTTTGTFGYMAANTTVQGFTFDENGVWK